MASLHPHPWAQGSALPRTLLSSGPRWCLHDSEHVLTFFFFSIKGCSPARMPPDGRASRQKSSNLPTRYTFSVHCAWIGKKAGKAERIYAFMLADSDSIISLKYCNCYFSWLVYSETANHSVRGQSLPWKGQWMDFGQGERRKSIKNI